MLMEKHPDHPDFKGGVSNGDELRSTLPPQNAICAHLHFGASVAINYDPFTISWDQLRH